MPPRQSGDSRSWRGGGTTRGDSREAIAWIVVVRGYSYTRSIVPAPGKEHPIVSLAAKLCALQADLKTLVEDETAKTSQYTTHYASKEALQDALRPLLDKHGLSFICSCTKQWEEGVVQTRQGPNPVTRVEVMGTFMDAESGEQFTVAGQGSAADSYDKGVYKAQTSAMRYMLMQALLISTAERADDAEQYQPDPPNRVELAAQGERIAERVIDMASQKGVDVAAVQGAIDDHRNRNGGVDPAWAQRQLDALAARPTPASPSPPLAAGEQYAAIAGAPGGAERDGADPLRAAATAAQGLAADPLAALVGAASEAPAAQTMGPTKAQETRLNVIVRELASLRPDVGNIDDYTKLLRARCQKDYGKDVYELAQPEVVAFIESCSEMLLAVRESVKASERGY